MGSTGRLLSLWVLVIETLWDCKVETRHILQKNKSIEGAQSG